MRTGMHPAVGPLVSAFLGFVIVIGTVRPWAKVGVFSVDLVTYYGIDDDRGVIALIAGFAAMTLGLMRAFLRLPAPVFFAGSLICGVAALGLAASYWNELADKDSIDLFGAHFDVAERGIGLYVTAGGAVLYLMALFWQLASRLSGPREA